MIPLGKLKKVLFIALLVGLAWGQDTVTDIDGNVYETVQIGEQLWMAENLKVTHYNNGDPVTYITSEEHWGSMDEGQYGVYDDEPTNANIYGNLYNWAVIGDIRGICPVGWHVPSDDEYTVLTDFLGGESVAGGKMKEAGLEHWNYDSDQISLEATNESGFTGLPAGHRNTNSGDYIYMGFYGYFWSSTENGSDLAWRRYLFHYSSGVARDTFGKPNGFSIRCVTDDYILGDINGDEILNVLDIVQLVNSGNYSGNTNVDHIVATFDDDAATGVSGTPVTGSFQPFGLLADFNGLSILGDWTLTFRDTVGLDPLSVNAWGLEITTAEAESVPEPASIALLGLGLAGMSLARKKKTA